MSLLNRPSDGYFNALLVIFRCLISRKRLGRSEILNLCAPPTLDGEKEPQKVQKEIADTLNRWHTLGLFEFDPEKKEYSLASDLPKELLDPDQLPERLPGYLRGLIFRPEFNREETFWENIADQTSDVTRSVAWVLAQDVYTMPTSSYDNAVAPFESRQFPQEGLRPLQNTTRWAGLKSWATFLGFGQSVGSEFFIDPTSAVRDALPDVFDSKIELAQTDFFERLARTVPVLDGGEYRLRVEMEISSDAWNRPESRTVSTSLSRALLRLHEAEEITLKDLPDAIAGKRSLLGQNERSLREVSHIKWLQN